jgi:hypothetical protein
MKIESGKFCPLLKKDCVGLQCNWMVHIKGTHPQTGSEIEEWECAIKWLPILMIETAKEVRQGAAATESLRNEMVSAARATITAISQAVEAPPIASNNGPKLVRSSYEIDHN